ncbi:MAG: 3-oxoacyl-[acyl-carrier-protein] reductase [Deltaproteobacteria bacterium]|nr:3-oxoacyl-[acyl-carrier-protein] reductase [Deltaproteobacteria bacterium]
MSFEGQIALVTGCSRGIGRVIAEDLARHGATVIATARDTDAIQSWSHDQKDIAARVLPAKLEVTDREAIDKLVEDLTTKHHKIDILVNNAGITKDGLLMNMSDEQFDEVINVNLRGAFWLCRAVSRHMVRARYGRIINIASFSGVAGNPGQANYSAAKAGLVGMTKAIAKELGKRGVTCNAVAPGFIDTDMTAVLPEKLKDQAKQAIPLQRFGTSAEVAAAVTFLSSKSASYITGQCLSVDGGLHT